MGIQLVTGGACLIVPPYELIIKLLKKYQSLKVFHLKRDLPIS